MHTLRTSRSPGRFSPLAALAVLVACSSSSPSGNASPPADAGGMPACVTASLVLSGPMPQSPHGVFLLTHVTLTSSSFSANLPEGGMLQLDWNGDATAGPVAITGQLALPVEDASAPIIWCIDTRSTLHIVGKQGQLALTMGLQGAGLCSATGQPQPTVDPASGCIDVST